LWNVTTGEKSFYHVQKSFFKKYKSLFSEEKSSKKPYSLLGSVLLFERNFFSCYIQVAMPEKIKD
jgi:hypothetical protein